MRVLTNGCFDLFHAGHATFLKHASVIGEVVVLLNSDDSVRRLKGEGRPIYDFIQRRSILLQVKSVAHVDYYEGEEEFTLNTIRSTVRFHDIGVYVRVVGDENSVESQVMRQLNIPCFYLPRVEGISTTEVIASLQRRFSP